MQSILNAEVALAIFTENASLPFVSGITEPTVPEAALQLIRRFEGLALSAYRCPAGRLTVGYGHVLKDSAGQTGQYSISVEQAEIWLLEDAALASRAVRRLISIPLNENQRSALISFTFNLGAAALQRSTLRQVILRGEESAIGQEWARWVWAGGRKLPGLALRRSEEFELFTSTSC